MSCNRSCRECPRKIYVNAVAFTGGTLVLTLPADRTYTDGCQYCFVITTAIPDTVTRNAPVAAVVGTGTVQFPLLTRCGTQVLEQQLTSRQRYPFRVSTTAAGGNLVILSCLPPVENTTLAALNDAVEGGA